MGASGEGRIDGTSKDANDENNCRFQSSQAALLPRAEMGRRAQSELGLRRSTLSGVRPRKTAHVRGRVGIRVGGRRKQIQKTSAKTNNYPGTLAD
jgi:hypothetical protein